MKTRDKYPWRDKGTIKKLLLDDGLSITAAADTLGCERSTVARWAKRLDVDISHRYHAAHEFSKGYRKPKPSVKFLDLKHRMSTTGDVLEKVKHLQESIQGMSVSQDEAEVEILTDKPISLTFMGDCHVGHVNTDYELLEEHLGLIEQAEGAYLMTTGDLMENPVLHAIQKHGSMHQESMVSPKFQKQLVEHLFARVSDRVLAMLQGHHEEWSYTADDFDFGEFITEQFGCPYLEHGGRLTVKVANPGDTTGQDYRIVARHSYRYNSSYNLTHAPKQMIRFFKDGDIGVVGHHHEGAIEEGFLQPGKPFIAIRLGSYKRDDRWARAVGYGTTTPLSPTVILWPDKWRMVPFKSIRDGIEYLQFLRGHELDGQ